MKRWLLLSLLLLPVAASAQFRYSAKFVCGRPTPVETGSMAVAPGTYFTAINIHNLSTNGNASLRKRFSSGNINERVGRLGPFISATIPPGQTILIDCREVLGHLGGPAFAEG